MNKSLAVLMTATVVIITGLVLITMTSGSLGDFGQGTTNSASDNNCGFQIKQIDTREDINDVDSECLPKDRGQQIQVLNDKYGKELTGGED